MNTISAINLETKGWITSNAEKMKESHPDDLINAWQMGVNKGLSLKNKIVKQYFEEKFNKALEEATQLFNFLNDKVKMNCKEAYFKVNDIVDFEVLYLVDSKNYLSEKLHRCYDEALKIKADCKKEDFSFNFSFKPKTKNTKAEYIYADGYILKYAVQTRKA